ncbi:MAG: hypothetical protein KZQ76_01920 [Candidatus Thiodiazotropha sp. (ex Epidulcina cf. delphinae)]|nr:hypothetical protein [Candidatus Thiodiazotropha sp. (ex Epidulcina cf. delphinae)]
MKAFFVVTSATKQERAYPSQGIDLTSCRGLSRCHGHEKKLPRSILIFRPYAMTSAYLLGLLALSFFIHQGALSGYWRFDDGWLLDFASRFSPRDYFLNPAITRGYSLNNLTPFNPFVYDLNLWLFGLSPRGFYFQHVTSLAGCAIAGFLLLRIWAPPVFAFLGAVAFLVGAPSLFVSQQLMVGHYLAGLFFSILAIYAYLHSVDRQNWWLTALATLFYFLATTCKEIYFPLPFVLPFFQRGRLSTRLYHAFPLVAWSAGYLFWRFIVLGSFVGGYDSGDRTFSIIKSLQAFSTIPSLLFGDDYLGLTVTLVFLVLLGYAAKNKKINIPLLIVGLLAVSLPLVPLTNFPGITQPNRYLLLPWWLISMTLATSLAGLASLSTAIRLLIGTLFITGIAAHAWQEQARIQPKLDRFDTIYNFFMTSPSERIFYSAGIKDAYYLDTVLNGARNTLARRRGIPTGRIGIIVRQENLKSVDTTRHSVWRYDDFCNCMLDISNELATADASLRSTTAPELLIVPVSPPYPPLFEYADGKIEHRLLNGSDLHIDGWSVQPSDDLEQQLILITPTRPGSYDIKANSLVDDPAHLSAFEFRLSLTYPDKESAGLAANQSCLLIRSALTPIKLLSDDNQSMCQGFLTTSQ